MARRIGAQLVLGLTLLTLLGTSGCNLWAVFWPPKLSPTEPYIHAAQASDGPSRAVEITYDDRYVPHIVASSREDASYALGFLHARDRLFQLTLLKFAAWGRLGELFGDGVLEADRELRLLSWNIEAEEAALGDDARSLASAFADGVNEGAEHAGRSVEMQILGVTHEPFTVQDVLAISRLQSWELSLDLYPELARSRILARLPAGDERRRALLADIPHRDVPIVSEAAESLLPSDVDAAASADEAAPTPPVVEAPPVEQSPTEAPPSAEAPAAAAPQEDSATEAAPTDEPPAGGAARDDASDVTPGFWGAEDWFQGGVGASNSWVVSGELTTTGKPVLSNDPHLAHRLPGFFYLVHIRLPNAEMIGGTPVGLPAVVIGAAKHVAWGWTTSFADTQDLVRIEVAPDSRDHYVVDGQRVSFGRRTQRFLAGGEVIRTEQWRDTRFGPVLPPVFQPDMEPGETLALMWAGHDATAAPRQLIAIWELAEAKTPAEATAALELFGATQNVVLAFDSGDIAYRLMGRIPRRLSTEPSDRPRDGKTAAAGWDGYLDARDKPQLTNPDVGYIVTANQRVVTRGHKSSFAIGGYSSTPHRAQRIHERIRELKERGKLKPADLLSIQQDVVSIEARELAPLLGVHCPEGITQYTQATVKAFCRGVREFDGAYQTSSMGALAFTALYEELKGEVIRTHLGEDVVPQLLATHIVTMAVEEAVLAEARGEESPLFDDRRTPQREGLKGFVQRAAPRALDRIVNEVGADPADWRWGKVHTISYRSPLARAPLIGSFFETEKRATGGWGRAPRAEMGLPVQSGSALRLLAQPGASAPRIVGELGNSGHRGHPHELDWRDEWELAQPFVIPTDDETIAKRAKARLRLLPKK